MAAVLTGIARLGTLILLLIARCLACAAPSGSRTRGWAILTLCCFFVSLAAGVVLLILAISTNWFMYRDNYSLVLVVGALCLLFVIAAHCLWMLFLRAVAAWSGDSSLARKCVVYLRVSIVFPVVVVFIGQVIVPMLASRDDLKGIELLLLMVVWAGGLVLLVWQRRLALQVREAIRPSGD